jgi:hypothetical protein
MITVTLSISQNPKRKFPARQHQDLSQVLLILEMQQNSSVFLFIFDKKSSQGNTLYVCVCVYIIVTNSFFN